jgi:hypothetical protein
MVLVTGDYAVRRERERERESLAHFGRAYKGQELLSATAERAQPLAADEDGPKGQGQRRGRLGRASRTIVQIQIRIPAVIVFEFRRGGCIRANLLISC